MEDVSMEPEAEVKEPSLDECLKLLRGGTDEQRFVGLLMVTKFVKGEDVDVVRKVFDAIGFQFIDRLIKTSAGAGQEGKPKAQLRSYRQLAVSILAAFCRVPELASLEETISKITLLLQTLADRDYEAATSDCLEALLSIATTSEAGLKSIPLSRALPIFSYRLNNIPPEVPWVPLAVKLLHCFLTRIASENTIAEYTRYLADMLLPVAKQLSFRQDLTKFEALSVLYSLLVSDISIPITGAIANAAIPADQWAAIVRTGLGQILHSRVAIEQKHQVLELAQAVVEIVGEHWLLGTMTLPDGQRRPPPNRFFVLVLETLRVETAVLLNEVARISFASGQEPQTSDRSAEKERRLMTCFALLEHIINIAANQEEENQRDRQASSPPGLLHYDEIISKKIIVVVDEIVGLVLELLEDAQGRNQNEGEILLACVRVASRFLAEVPAAHSERCEELLGFMLSVTTKDNERSFAAVQFMIPFLAQKTLTVDGINAFLSCNGHERIAAYLAWTVQNYIPGALVDICDIFLNILTKNNEINLNAEEFASVLTSLMAAVDHRLSDMESDMAAAVSVSVLALTREDALKRLSDVGPGVFEKIIQHVRDVVAKIAKAGGPDDQRNGEADLWDLILSGCVTCVEGRDALYPSLRVVLYVLLLNLIEDRRLSEQTHTSVEVWSSMRKLVTVLDLKYKLND